MTITPNEPDRAMTVAVKAKTQFGVVHIHLDFDDTGKFYRASYRANDAGVAPDTQIGAFAKQLLDGVTDAIHEANRTPSLTLSRSAT